MKYLSDEIYVYYSLPDQYKQTYQQYEVWTLQDNKSSLPEKIYTGRVFYNTDKGSPKIYLNDILESKYSNCEGFKEIYEDETTAMGPGIFKNDQPGILFRVKIIFPNVLVDGKPYEVTYFDEIYNGYPMINNNTNVISKSLTTDDTFTVYQPWQMNNDIAPRIPKLPNSNNFFMGIDFMLTKGATTNTINIKDENGVLFETWDQPNFNTMAFFSKTFKRITGDIFIEVNDGSGGDWIKAIELDPCPADFYCIWVDRLGGTQCQPFEKRSVMKENIIISNITDYRERTRPYNKSVEYSWDLNTDWIDEKSYRTYESILVSPYIYLYDVQKDLGYWVICNQNSWTEKTVKNQKQLFNFNITLTANKNQKLLF